MNKLICLRCAVVALLLGTVAEKVSQVASFGTLKRTVDEYVECYHHERPRSAALATNYPGLDHLIPFPYAPRNEGQSGSVVKFERGRCHGRSARRAVKLLLSRTWKGGVANRVRKTVCQPSRQVTCGDSIAKIDPSVATILILKYFPSVFVDEIRKAVAN